MKQKKIFEYDNKGSFGELALMHNSPRAATVQAKTEGISWAVDRKKFCHIIVGSTAEKDIVMIKLAIFNKISDTTKSQIADILEGFDFKQGDVIIEQGSTNCRKFYLIQYGTASVVNDGKTHIVKYCCIVYIVLYCCFNCFSYFICLLYCFCFVVVFRYQH